MISSYELLVEQTFSDLMLEMNKFQSMKEMKDRLQVLIEDVNEEFRGDRKKYKDPAETRAKLFAEDPKGRPDGFRKPGELEEIVETIEQELPPYLVADELADVGYYAYQLEEEGQQVLNQVADGLGWDEEDALKIVLIKYITRTRYGLKAFEGNKERVKIFEQEMMRRFFQKHPELAEKFSPSPQLKTTIEQITTEHTKRN